MTEASCCDTPATCEPTHIPVEREKNCERGSGLEEKSKVDPCKTGEAGERQSGDSFDGEDGV